MRDISKDSGLWSIECYHSGTHVVKSENVDLPHYYVYGDERREVCLQLAGWLNFSDRPRWADTLKRIDNIKCDGDFGIRIIATGPMITGGRIDPTKEHERVALIDSLFDKVNR